MKTDLGNIPSDLTSVNLLEGQLAQSRLEATVRRFNTDLNEYFRLAQNVASDDISLMSTTQLEVEEALAELGVKINRILLEVKSNESKTASPTINVSSKLPKLSLPEFDGDILGWHQYWDQFRSNIDSKRLSDVDKLSYLKASLKGDAKKAIEGLETTNRNYGIALTTLKERYGKPSYLIDAHYSALYKINTAKYTAPECRQTLNEVERHLRVLESLGEDINHNHLRFLIMEKFPSELVYELRLRTSMDSIKEIREQLEKAISAREDAERATQRKTSNGTESCTVEALHIQTRQPKFRSKPMVRENKFKARENPTGFKKYPQKRSYDHIKTRNETETRENPPLAKKPRKFSCIFCGGDHYNEACDTHKTPQERKMQLKDRCFICFKKGHRQGSCKQPKRKCPHCNRIGNHNRALCPSNFLKNQNPKTPQ